MLFNFLVLLCSSRGFVTFVFLPSAYSVKSIVKW